MGDIESSIPATETDLPEVEVGSYTPVIATVLPGLDMDEIKQCQDDEDCVIAAYECCGVAVAINKQHLELWNAHMDAKKLECAGVMCEPGPPLDYFIARCVDNACVERESTCGEEIESLSHYVEIVRSHPAIEQLNLELNLLEVQVPGPCVIDGKVSAKLRYELPANLSSFDIIYKTDLNVLYHVDDGELELIDDSSLGSTGTQAIIDPAVALSPSIKKITEIENDPRVVEFLTKLDYSKPRNVFLNVTTIRLHAEGGFIEFSFPSWREQSLVNHYIVPNAIEWLAFPEINQAHQLIQDNLLVGDWAHCFINNADESANSNTMSFRGFEEHEPWMLEVGLDCDGELRTAVVIINPDGSYQRLEIR
jgi:hypothetical protein